MPLISFIVPIYGIPQHMVDECLASIRALALSEDEREIIVLDDPEHEGLSAVRNKGLAQATGEYIQFVDGDDCLRTRTYNSIIRELKKEHYFGKPDVLMFKFTRKAEAKSFFTLPLFWMCSAKEYLTKKNLRAAAWGYVFRREVLGDIRFTEGIYHEDEEFTPQLLLRCNTVLYTSLKAYYYRIRENSITRSEDEELIAKRKKDFLEVILRLRHLSLTREGLLLERRVNQLTMDYVWNFKELPRVLGGVPIRFYTLKYFLYAIYCKLKN